MLQHAGVDVGQHHQARFTDLARQSRRQIAGAAGDIQRPIAGLSPVSDSVNCFHSRCAPADIRSFIRS
jgi:hypothetical protein